MNQNILARHRNIHINSYLSGKEKDSAFNYDIHEAGQPLTALEEEDSKILSIVATAYDLRDAVRIIKKQPQGMSLVEAMDPFKKRVLHLQKIAVYEQWGIIVRDGDWLSLSALGWELARMIEPQVAVFWTVLETNPRYMSALNWAYRHRVDRISHLDVVAHWAEEGAISASADRRSSNKVNAICFFHLCQAAELGTVTLGKRGQPARLLLDRDELGRRLGVDTFPPAISTTDERIALKPLAYIKSGNHAAGDAADPAIFNVEKKRVLVSCPRQSPVIKQVQSALTIADLECAVVERGGAGVALLIDQARLAARNLVACVVILTSDDFRKDETGEWRLNEEVAMVIGAIRVFCDNRVVALCESGLATPGNLIDLKQCEFDGESLNWEAGVQLMEAIKGWKI